MRNSPAFVSRAHWLEVGLILLCSSVTWADPEPGPLPARQASKALVQNCEVTLSRAEEAPSSPLAHVLRILPHPAQKFLSRRVSGLQASRIHNIEERLKHLLPEEVLQSFAGIDQTSQDYLIVQYFAPGTPIEQHRTINDPWMERIRQSLDLLNELIQLQTTAYGANDIRVAMSRLQRAVVLGFCYGFSGQVEAGESTYIPFETSRGGAYLDQATADFEAVESSLGSDPRDRKLHQFVQYLYGKHALRAAQFHSNSNLFELDTGKPVPPEPQYKRLLEIARSRLTSSLSATEEDLRIQQTDAKKFLRLRIKWELGELALHIEGMRYRLQGRLRTSSPAEAEWEQALLAQSLFLEMVRTISPQFLERGLLRDWNSLLWKLFNRFTGLDANRESSRTVGLQFIYSKLNAQGYHSLSELKQDLVQEAGYSPTEVYGVQGLVTTRLTP